MSLYLIVKETISNNEGLALNDIAYACESNVFVSSETELEQDLNDFLNEELFNFFEVSYNDEDDTYEYDEKSYTFDEIHELINEDGYMSVNVNSDEFEVSQWNENGEGTLVRYTVKIINS